MARGFPSHPQSVRGLVVHITKTRKSKGVQLTYSDAIEGLVMEAAP